MNEQKCIKCGFFNETFQRGALITGTRCLSCGYETLAKVCKSVGEIKLFFEKMSDATKVVFQDESAPIIMEAHFTGSVDKTEQVKTWQGPEK